MTLGLIPMSHFLTAGTDPNVTFGQCQVTCGKEEEEGEWDMDLVNLAHNVIFTPFQF